MDIPPSMPQMGDQVDAAKNESLGTDGVDSDLRGSGDVKDFYYTVKRGLHIIFNHDRFETYPKLPDRKGAHVDERELRKVWESLGFEVLIHNNLTKDKIFEIIRTYSRTESCEKYDCFACTLMTHGDKMGLLYAKDSKYCLNVIIQEFKNCAALVGIPKLFFIQACRGTTMDSGKLMRRANDATDSGAFDDKEEIIVPTESDLLIAYSTVEGYYSWRNLEEGSWFVQQLAHCLEKLHENWDLLQILTMVNMEVGRKASCTNLKGSHGMKQSPSIVSQLTKLIRFEKPNKPIMEEADSTVCNRKNEQESTAMFHISNSTRSVSQLELQPERQEELEYYQLKQGYLEKKRELANLKLELCNLKLKSLERE